MTLGRKCFNASSSAVFEVIFYILYGGGCYCGIDSVLRFSPVFVEGIVDHKAEMGTKGDV